ncbi:CRISPR-associated helicase Cas3' [Photorhabdus heterorhabditis]|uniref:CRISPR-associated helicase Cas3' n=1 Tax=Photorhabdus heterorhabditis TaxID=880156 RepID=UPI00156206C0|nr:CRISPR-associated helicase Cas3' [Photorhabdus heterorhabditis]NRN30692.1 CRISPR-associated helicase Cas3' [Photorhabdus heterorhabditis subsp. aluminescens]
MEIPIYFQYWGKSKSEPEANNADYHLLPYHCLDVAAVGIQLLSLERSLTKDLANFLALSTKQLQSIISFVLALHDIGKFASAFQRLFSHQAVGLFQPYCLKKYNGRYFGHARLGLYFWENIKTKLLKRLVNIEGIEQGEQQEMLDTLMVFMDCVLGHHGQPIDKTDYKVIKRFTEPHNFNAVTLFAHHLIELLQPKFPIEKLRSKEWRRRLEQVSWQFAGITVLADWIGSDNHYFKYQSEPMSLTNYWQYAQTVAEKAVMATELGKAPIVKPFISIQEYYGFAATPLQQWAESIPIDNSPQLFILEDVSGAGKTEAALALTHRLMQVKAADGFYFGLPSMATSDAMFSRMAEHYQQMLSTEDGSKPDIVLAHGTWKMNEQFCTAALVSGYIDRNDGKTDITASVLCSQWLADSRKKALLAPAGIGTIDQALLAVLPRRHQSLRLFGLNHKVLIVDEVHAADEFMFNLLENLLALHIYQGGSAILLTATLTLKQRQRLADIWLNAGGLNSQLLQKIDFPLATKIDLNPVSPIIEQPLSSRKDVNREVKVEFLNSFGSCVEKVLAAIVQGQCVVWIRNTVDDAIEAYQVLRNLLTEPERCLLFHSQFVLQHRKEIESRVITIFGKNSYGEMRRGKALIATRVFQESLDTDADVMISDICPIDDLIQRAGRLHRHTRDSDGIYQHSIKDSRPAPVLFVHAPDWKENPESDWLSHNFRNTQYVYRSPARLWLGMRVLRKLGAIRMPMDARQLIEAVYGYDDEQVPEALRHREDVLIGEERSQAAKAKSYWLQWQLYGYCDRSADSWYEDDSGINTRYCDIETVEVLLLKQTDSGQLVPWVNSAEFSVPLSTVKLSKNKYADKLAPIPTKLIPALNRLQQRYHQIKYLQPWLPDKDPNFTYSSIIGFCEK